MKMTTVLILALCLHAAAAAQTVSGNVADAETRRYMEQVLVVNHRTQASVYTNSLGLFSIPAAVGDTLVYMMAGYRTVKTPVPPGNTPARVLLLRQRHTLDEVEVLPELEKFEREHAEMMQTYDKTIKDADRKVKRNYGNGIMFTGLISRFAEVVSGERKKDKQFRKSFNAMEEQKLIAIRYNPELVMFTTRTSADSAVMFINSHPMDVNFAMQASFLELQMWVRERFAVWVQPGGEQPKPQGTKD